MIIGIVGCWVSDEERGLRAENPWPTLEVEDSEVRGSGEEKGVGLCRKGKTAQAQAQVATFETKIEREKTTWNWTGTGSWDGRPQTGSLLPVVPTIPQPQTHGATVRSGWVQGCVVPPSLSHRQSGPFSLWWSVCVVCL